MAQRFIVFIFLIMLGMSCNKMSPGGGENKPVGKLPILGNRHVENIEISGGIKADTVYHTVPDFSFINQDGDTITHDKFKGRVYVADFFFTTCPTICPTMKAQMLRIYEKFMDNDQLLILSHSIDPVHDNVAVLRDFAEKLGVESSKWHFVTGEKDKIYEQGMKGYMVTAGEDRTAPGGYIHSGAFILVDKERRIRGIYDGTKSLQVDELMQDILILLAEYED